MELTSRELDVLRLAAEGCTRLMTAQRLGISQNTVATHRAGILEKMKAVNITHAIAIAYWLGILR